MNFNEFHEKHKPRRGLHIRITARALGTIGMAVATFLGNRRKKKKEAIAEVRRKAHR